MPSRARLAQIALFASAAACVRPANVQRSAIGGRGLALRYEGTCAHLACCSAYAVPAPHGGPGAFQCGATHNKSCSHNVGWFAPAFTCDPSGAARYRQPQDPPYLGCNDSDVWLSIPNLTHRDCGTHYLVCAAGKRVLAVVRDRSAGNDSGNVYYEGSYGLLSALGADVGAQETRVSIYATYEAERIAADPACAASP